MKNTTLLLCLLVSLSSFGQKFIKPAVDRPLLFTEMQLQFDQWKTDNDLRHKKGWKYFKRWEMDQQLHCDGRGQIADPTDYINAAVDVAAQKQAEQNSPTFMNNWYPVGPNYLPGNETGYMTNGIGRINCIAFHPTDANTYYVGVAQGGLWKTTNNGTSWTPLTDNLPITRISDIAIDPADPNNTMYISVCDFEYVGFGLYLNGKKRNTHYGLGVYKTTDGGVTWNPTGLSFTLTQGDASLIRRVIVDPSNSNNVLACGVSGMYRSTDAGATWTQITTGVFWDMQEDPATPHTLYAATGWIMTSNVGSCSIKKSTDFGLTWTTLTTGIPATGQVQRIKLAIAPSDPNYVYALACDASSGLFGIYKSTNAGTSWTLENPGVNILEAGDGTGFGGQGTYDLGLVVDPTNRNMIFTGGVNIWGSSDGGLTFDPASHWTLFYGPSLHGDIHYMTVQPTSGQFFVCSDGGVYKTSNITTETWNAANGGNPWPTLWTNVGSNLQITSFYRISSSRNSAARLMGGAQDNASMYYDNGTWNTIFGGDGMDNWLDPLDDNIVIGSSQYGYFSWSNDDGVTDLGTTPNFNNENAEWTSPIVADYNNAGRLYCGFQNVYKSTDNGQNWTQISNFTEPTYGTEISAMAVSNTNANTMYVCKRVRYEYNENGKIYKTTNGGGNWTNITAGVPDTLYYTSVEVSETDANTAWVTLAGFCAGQKVYRTTNGGTSWTNMSLNLPNIPVNCVKYIPGAGTVMIATDLGIYMYDNVNNTWVLRSSGLPNVICSDIEFNVNQNKIYVSTFGRGIWATDLDVFTSVLNPTDISTAVTLFPSPNNGTFTINVGDNNSTENFQLDIVDVMGRIVHSEKCSGSSSYAITIDVPPGVYFAHMTGERVKGVKSFIVK
ncbi:MAG TPA: T9SS type A sorting domain-containing protein [Bacteroidia bacterium]|jgi:photosystem II stability/assembly factor-like uncharacterized protein|nr:T9SS type A sorting domain-containing protein [Bacteroidia bacterium]